MKRYIALWLLLLASVLSSCTVTFSDGSSTTAGESETQAARPEATVPSTTSATPVQTTPTANKTEPPTPSTSEPITAPQTDEPPTTDLPPALEKLPEMGSEGSVLEYTSRKILYTVAKTPLYTRDGTPLYTLGAGHAVVAVEQTDGAVTILYRGRLCELRPDQLTNELPTFAVEKQTELGGIYYPAGNRTVGVDAGHQGKAMKEKEPVGPGSTTLKAMLSSGTAGVSTRIAERELNLRVSMLLRDELISRGYSVMMIRESHEVTISNAQRAQVANAYGVDAFIRVHGNGSSNPDARGAMTICQTATNPYNGELFDQSYALSERMLDEYCAATEIKKNNVWKTDTMTGINWATVPTTIVEMGYMSNAEEDQIMATDTFRKNAAIGIANGIEAFFAWQDSAE